MNILLASVDTLPNMGGISTMAHHLANAFCEAGHSTTLMGPKGSYLPRGFSREYGLIEDFESAVRHQSGDAGLRQDERIRGLLRSVFARYGIERVLLLHPFYYAVGALDVCAEYRVPCSVYFHGFELRSQLREGYPRSQKQIVRQRVLGTLRERVFYTIGAASEILVNSRYVAGLFDGFPRKPSVRATGCGISEATLRHELDCSPEYDPQRREQRRTALGLPSGTCLGYVGRLVPTKRVDRLLAMCKHEPSLSAVIIGAGPEQARLQALADEYGVTDRVRFTGQVGEQEKWVLLRSVDFQCLLSSVDDERGNVEGFGIALLEGAAAGAVPVSSGTGGMSDVVQDGSTGIIVPDDDAQAARALVELAREPERMAQLVSSARARLESSFTWSAVADNVLAGWT